jgi:hypothetical protein
MCNVFIYVPLGSQRAHLSIQYASRTHSHTPELLTKINMATNIHTLDLHIRARSGEIFQTGMNAAAAASNFHKSALRRQQRRVRNQSRARGGCN